MLEGAGMLEGGGDGNTRSHRKPQRCLLQAWWHVLAGGYESPNTRTCDSQL